jgi:uncharacterized membrane protein YphA (DoxX/SURF4 family)
MKQVISTLLLTIMFVLSGLSKISNFDKTVNNVQLKLNVSPDLSKLGVLLVILIEVVAPVLIIYHLITQKIKPLALYSVWALIGFTCVVTLIYHQPDFSTYYKSIAFWSNVSLVGGLLLLFEKLEK